MSWRILIVDDDRGILGAVAQALAGPEVEIHTADSGAEGNLLLDEMSFDLLLTDLVLPDCSGMDLLRRLQQESLPTLCVLMTGHATVDGAVEALKTGAFDYITKPFKAVEIRHVVDLALQRQRLLRENRRLHEELTRVAGTEAVVGRSKGMQEVFRIIERVRDLDTTVLITGESGTGKEVIARALHQAGRRKEKPFVALNCGAIPPNLMEDELFGHVKGAFTDAVAPRPGVFEQADGGTLFLDEIGTLRTDLQVKLLRVLQEREFRPIGSPNLRRINVRVIAATNSDLREAIVKGTFREDLFYRLNIIHLAVPPLRGRMEDLIPLLSHFIKKLAPRMGLPEKAVSREAIEALLEHSWPGNVRELENAVERAMALSQAQDRIDLGDLPPEILGGGAAEALAPGRRTPLPQYVETLGLDAYLRRSERALIIEALGRSRWMKSRAARLLKVQRTTLVERMKRLGIPMKRDGGAGSWAGEEGDAEEAPGEAPLPSTGSPDPGPPETPPPEPHPSGGTP